MYLRLTILFLLMLLLSPAQLCAKPSTAAVNAESLVGTWNILDQNNALIDSIEITIAVAKKNTARFSFTQASHTEQDSLEGYLTNDTVIFDLINLANTQTYIAKVDFDLGGGPGVEIKTKLADCTGGLDDSDVAKKNRKRLANDSMRCNGSAFNDSTERAIKFVKQGTNAASIASNGATAAETLTNETKVATRVEGAWSLSGSHPSIVRRMAIKDISSNHLGYKFTYRLLNNKTKLANLNESDFETANRTGYIVNNFMVINPTVFYANNELFVVRLANTLKQGTAREIRTPNGDCFQLRVPVASTLACTPNDSSSRTSSISKRIDNRKARRINSNVVIAF